MIRKYKIYLASAITISELTDRLENGETLVIEPDSKEADAIEESLLVLEGQMARFMERKTRKMSELKAVKPESLARRLARQGKTESVKDLIRQYFEAKVTE
jgi:cytidylate kinase